jgi:hypothetical protein
MAATATAVFIPSPFTTRQGNQTAYDSDGSGGCLQAAMELACAAASEASGIACESPDTFLEQAGKEQSTSGSLLPEQNIAGANPALNHHRVHQASLRSCSWQDALGSDVPASRPVLGMSLPVVEIQKQKQR